MTDLRNEKVSALVALLCDGLPGKKATAVTFKAYEIGLEDLAVEQIEEAVHRALRTCKFVPSVAELREMCGCLTTEQRTVKAWAVLNEALRKHHYYESILFDDPALQATVHNLGGWIQLSERWSDTPVPQWDAFARKDFERVYAAFVASRSWGEAGSMIQLGWFDRTNRGNGMPDKADGTPCRDHLVAYATGLPLLPGPSKPSRPRLPQRSAPLELAATIGRAVE